MSVGDKKVNPSQSLGMIHAGLTYREYLMAQCVVGAASSHKDFSSILLDAAIITEEVIAYLDKEEKKNDEQTII